MKKSRNPETIAGVVGGLQVIYVSALSELWAEQVPRSNWLLFAIADAATQVPANAVTACLRRNPAGICCAGTYAPALEDIFDLELALQTVNWEIQHPGPGPEHNLAMPVTTSDTNIQDALCYAITVAPGTCEKVIDTVVCIDFTHSYQTQIRELVTQLATGWLPAAYS